MDIVSVVASRRFSAEKMQKVNLFDTPRMFCDLYCFAPGQEQKVHTHPKEDKVYFVLEGHVTFRIGDEERTVGAGHAVLAPMGVPHGVRNDSDVPAVLLVFMAPNPNY
ncbi:MAG: cupin domain-containing protein [Abditibacteriales bacterium]|nr:cupin domain-containing protein [Abditibacteriales bacterium]MDW8365758.1 cupin domain-containing protein [Abditibacteriales bacterium]